MICWVRGSSSVRRIVKGSVHASLRHVLVGVIHFEDNGLVCAHVGVVVICVRAGAHCIAHLHAQHVFGAKRNLGRNQITSHIQGGATAACQRPLVSPCMCVCVWCGVCVCVRARAWMCAHAVSAFVRVPVHVCADRCTCMCVCAHTHMHMRICACVHSCIHTVPPPPHIDELVSVTQQGIRCRTVIAQQLPHGLLRRR